VQQPRFCIHCVYEQKMCVCVCVCVCVSVRTDCVLTFDYAVQIVGGIFGSLMVSALMPKAYIGMGDGGPGKLAAVLRQLLGKLYSTCGLPFFVCFPAVLLAPRWLKSRPPCLCVLAAVWCAAP
jgi:hypothetical protein